MKSLDIKALPAFFIKLVINIDCPNERTKYISMSIIDWTFLHNGFHYLDLKFCANCYTHFLYSIIFFASCFDSKWFLWFILDL